MANINGTISATGVDGKVFAPRVAPRDNNVGAGNVWLSGAGSAQIQLERSPDNGVTWFGVFAAGSSEIYQWTYSGTAISDSFQEMEPGVIYRLNCTAYTSGPITYSITGPQ